MTPERLSEIEGLIAESYLRRLGYGFVEQLTTAIKELVLEVRTNGRPHFNKTMNKIALLEAREGSGRVMHGALKAAFIANANDRDAQDTKNYHGGADGVEP